MLAYISAGGFQCCVHRPDHFDETKGNSRKKKGARFSNQIFSAAVTSLFSSIKMAAMISGQNDMHLLLPNFV